MFHLLNVKLVVVIVRASQRLNSASHPFISVRIHKGGGGVNSHHFSMASSGYKLSADFATSDTFFDAEEDLYFNCLAILSNRVLRKDFISLLAISHFVDEIDVLDHFCSLVKCCLSGPTLGLYSRLDPSSETHKRLLLEACTLQTNLFGYKTHSPTSAVQIYLSTSKCEPPIIIDIGASDSLTPLSTDFKNKLIQSVDLKSLQQVNGSTQVCGAGVVDWEVEDMMGTKATIETTAYFVPAASIRLFSPQAYIGNCPSANLVLDCNGVCFQSRCGTILKFPFNPSSNLPFMLTESLLAHQREFDSQPVQLQPATSAQAIYRKAASPISVNTTAAAGLIEQHQVLTDNNHNLSNSQKELLSWHC